MVTKYTVTAFTENKPGVLYRIADLFLRRKINIESLTVSETERHGTARFTIVVRGEYEVIEKVVKQLYRIIEVIKVFESKDEDLIFKELALIKISTKDPQRRREAEDLAHLFRAKVNYVGPDFMVIEISGSEDEIQSLFTLLRPFGIKEFTRSGRIAVLKNETTIFSKQSRLIEPSDIANIIDVSAIKKIQLMANETEGVIPLAQGIPSFFTSAHIRKAAHEAIDANLVDKYTPGYGIESLREAIALKVQKENRLKADVSNVIVTHGGIEALMSTFIALLNPEDQVIILTPDYASHITQTQIARHGGRPIFVSLDETDKGWVLNSEKVEAAITQNTKAILVCNPCNPTGKVYTYEELKQIARTALKYNLYIITDEMYEYFIFDDKKHISIGSFPEVADRVISIYGLSKSYAMTGWRIGYIVAHKAITKQIFKIHDSLITCPTAVSQYAALAAIKGPKDMIEIYKNAFAKRRNIVMNALSKSDKLVMSPPEGAYYAFPKFCKEIDDYELSMRLIKEGGVAVIPGSAFGVGGENHVRISFGGDEKLLKEGLERLVRYINTYI